MQGYTPGTYGAGFADVYDEWYRDVSDVEATADLLESLVPRRPLRVLELAVGTGRLALPIARRGHDVTGVDISADMLRVLAATDPEGLVTTIEGDMVADQPDGPFDVVLVAYTSLFMLTDPTAQAACFGAAAERLAPDGVFVVEAFVPSEPPRSGSDVSLRSMTATTVVLSVSNTDADSQRVDGHFVELANSETVRLRPYSLRYSTIAELDGFAAAAGLRLSDRFADVERTPFDPETSRRHVSVYRHM